jgi:hypothetical protein
LSSGGRRGEHDDRQENTNNRKQAAHPLVAIGGSTESYIPLLGDLPGDPRSRPYLAVSPGPRARDRAVEVDPRLIVDPTIAPAIVSKMR